MSKFTPVAIILAGAGGATGSYYSAPKHRNRTVNSKIKILFKDKYSVALLDTGPNKDSTIWDKKWNLMQGKDPVHPKLKDSLKHRSKVDTSKKLLREACQDIYNSAVIATPYFSDFKNYCSKDNKDGIGGTWISSNTQNSPKKKPANEWDEKLTLLKNDDKKNLQGDMLEWNLKWNADTKRKPWVWKKEEREELKKWCDSFGAEMFSGKDGMDVQNAKKYCTK